MIREATPGPDDVDLSRVKWTGNVKPVTQEIETSVIETFAGNQRVGIGPARRDGRRGHRPQGERGENLCTITRQMVEDLHPSVIKILMGLSRGDRVGWKLANKLGVARADLVGVKALAREVFGVTTEQLQRHRKSLPRDADLAAAVKSLLLSEQRKRATIERYRTEGMPA